MLRTPTQEILFEPFEQEDGAIWHIGDFDNGKVLLTSTGKELREARPEVESVYIPAYISKYLGEKSINLPVETREYIGSGATSTVYELAPDIAVKEVEKKKASTPHVLERMDRLMSIIEKRVPRWIDMPDQYGVVMHRCSKFDFIAQQKIDSGITVDWLLKPSHLSDFQRESIEREFDTVREGEVSEGEQDAVGEAFTEAKELLSRAIEESGADVDEYLVDYHEGNVIVERLRTPVADKRHKLWIIDQ